ncbi:MAG TPA: 30S ribosomal protein S12 methylthiotransferase RimO [bacterium]|nr:30S ribosomal protein S12 methylthiotransferase RimO [bacterium]
MGKKVSIISLGCAKNLVDSENILALLGEDKFVITDSYKESDIVIINTCAFIKDAVDESIRVIKKIAEKKNRKKIIVCGCLVQRFKEKIFKIADIDGAIGTGDPGKVFELVKTLKDNKKILLVDDKTFVTSKTYPRLITTFPYAYLKISEGCNNKCNYCLIPYLRGNQRSRKIKDILKEADDLSKSEIKEIVIIAQDTTNYGTDLRYGTNLKELLVEITKYDFKWVRIMYCNPARITGDLIEEISKNEKICKYLDIPLQHSHPEIIKKMGRPVINYNKIIENIRKGIKEVRLRTTFMIGFPGEKEVHFKHLVNFIKENKFDRCGFFKYSREKGTSSFDFDQQIDEEIKDKRLEKVVKIQERISKNKLKNMVGKTYDVLIEKKDGQFYIGRTEYDAPEVDGVVFVSGKNLKLGNFYKVKITSSSAYDISGEVII